MIVGFDSEAKVVDVDADIDGSIGSSVGMDGSSNAVAVAVVGSVIVGYQFEIVGTSPGSISLKVLGASPPVSSSPRGPLLSPFIFYIKEGI